MTDGATWRGVEWRGMVPARCQSCGAQVGVRTPGPEPDPSLVSVRCTACAAVEEAESILRAEAA